MSFAQLRERSRQYFVDSSFFLEITDLFLVLSLREQAKEAYLVKNVLERYSTSDQGHKNSYFASGDGWEKYGLWNML